MKVDILAIGAHPDDVELGAGGTIAAEIAKGRRVCMLDLTRGELGTRGSADLRDQEAARAAEILGVDFRVNLGFRDGFIANDEEHQLEVIRMIRLYRPEVVICNAIHDRHTDHGKSSKLVSDSCFLSGLQRIETEFDGVLQQAWRPRAVYHYIQDRYIQPDFVVDITIFRQKKMDAILAFSSQFYNPASDEPQTAISSQTFLQFIEGRMLEFGRQAGFDYGEGFTVERYPGVKSVFDLY